MPMYCPTCEYCEDSMQGTCPKCGGKMRFSLLAGFVSADTTSGFVKIRSANGPTVMSRLSQFIVGVVFSILLAVGLSFLVFVGVAIASDDPDRFSQNHPALFQMFASLVIVFAPVLAVLCLQYGVYLAQLMGLVIGGVGAATLCLLKVYLGMSMTPADWIVVPVSAAFSFVVGLLIAGKLPVVEEFEFKPINAWDRNARPSERELPGDVNRNWLRVLLGIFIGWAGWHGVSGLLYMIFKPLIKNPTLLEASMMRVEIPLHAVGCLAAGMMAGSANRVGAVPGMIVGTVIFAMVQIFEPAPTIDGVALHALLTIVPATIGGMLGRRIFRPNIIYGNARHLPAPLATRTSDGSY